jgi:outer membrane receptor protein involved in Fe transport
MKGLIFGLFLIVFTSLQGAKAQAQREGGSASLEFNGVISGLIIDSIAQKPIEYAAVTALYTKDSTLAGGMVTDEMGVFRIEKLKPGNYFLRIKYIGYNQRIIPALLVSADLPNIDLGKIIISPATQNLNEVEIKHYTEVMEANLDKRIVNVEKDLTSVGGTALDVMKNVPSVQVDVDNTISLRGSTSVNVMIDGRITTMNPATMLMQIPATMVKQIEVITNPSAKYDPDGVSGIINVITKKERKPGFNGIFNLGAGSGSSVPGGGIENSALNKYNFNTSMNFQRGKFNLFGSYDGRKNTRWNTGSTDRELYLDDTTTNILNQNNGKLRPSINHTGKIGTDITFNAQNLFTISGGLRADNGTGDEDINYSETAGDGSFINRYARKNLEKTKERGYDGAANFKHLFKNKGHEIIFDGSFSKTKTSRNTFVNESYYNVMGDVFSQDSITDDISENGSRQLISAQVDYVNPTQKFGRFESGLKYLGRVNSMEIETITNRLGGDLYKDENRSNGFQYSDHILSAYGIYANSFKKFKYQAGMRFEQAFTLSNQVTLNQQFERNFYNFFPSMHLKYAVTDEKEFALSYSKRVNRPGNGQLNPYPDYSDKLNYRIGNPYLKPEFVDSYELSFGKFTRNLSFTITGFYRNTKNNITRFKRIGADGISVISFENVSESHSPGAEVTYNQTFSKWFRMNGNVSAFYYLLEADEEFQTEQSDNFSYTARVSLNFVLSKNFDMQLTGNYRGPSISVQGVVSPMGNIDFGCKQELWNKKASLALRVSDIFNTQRFMVASSYINYYAEVTHKWETRTLYLTFTYRINQGVEKREKPKGDQGGGGDMGM